MNQEYQDAAKKLSPSVEIEFRDVNERRVISKFADKFTEKALYGAKFKRHTLIVALDKLIFDLNKRSQVYAKYTESQREINKTVVYSTWSKKELDKTPKKPDKEFIGS
ncbi:hypothetical protein TNCV_4265291 [Trichonephila clavipes]|nr:hypothetical protein TNCV_4265291 [Trichonephila clavipes]